MREAGWEVLPVAGAGLRAFAWGKVDTLALVRVENRRIGIVAREIRELKVGGVPPEVESEFESEVERDGCCGEVPGAEP